jgi:hypothetical protein
MNWTMNAVYRDSDGYEYKVPVIKTSQRWKLRTPLGDRNIEFYLLSADNSVISFHEYRLQAPKGIRPCDYLQAFNAWIVQLSVPQRPANAPETQKKSEDTRLHIEPKRPGQSSFSQLQEAGARAEAHYRANRERERQQAQREMQPSSDQIQQARTINNYIAAQIYQRRNRRGD